jgi:hypothetical protein
MIRMDEPAGRLWIGAAAACLVAGALAGCGRLGQLQPPGGGNSAERTDREPSGRDNAPRSTREMQDPNQQNVPASRSPIPGSVPDPFGPQPSMRPPGR